MYDFEIIMNLQKKFIELTQKVIKFLMGMREIMVQEMCQTQKKIVMIISLYKRQFLLCINEMKLLLTIINMIYIVK